MSRTSTVGAVLGKFRVAWKRIIWVMLFVLLVASLSAMVAYRLGARHSRFSRSTWLGLAGFAKGGCVDFHDAPSRVGETACVSGRVLHAFTSSRGTSFLDFCADYRDCPFAAVIFASDRDKFGDLDSLAGRQVELQGSITVYQGRAEIIIHGPQQIRVFP